MNPVYLIIFVLVLLIVPCLGVHLVEWRMYSEMRSQRDSLQDLLGTVIRDRDSWRSVAERALLIAQMGRNVGNRAASVITRVVS